jgi:hypothetical protein
MTLRDARASGKRVLAGCRPMTKVGYTVISRAVHIHPTISELIPTMLQELQPLDPGSP